MGLPWESAPKTWGQGKAEAAAEEKEACIADLKSECLKASEARGQNNTPGADKVGIGHGNYA